MLRPARPTKTISFDPAQFLFSIATVVSLIFADSWKLSVALLLCSVTFSLKLTWRR